MQTKIDPQKNNPGKLSVRTSKGKEFFLPGQIVRLEAKSNYTRIYFTNRFSLVTARVLKDFELLLIPLGFVRTHRSHLLNKQYILQVLSNGTIIMIDNSTAEISKRRKAAVLRSLQVLTVRA
ncbi:MAG: LytTR family DNA-binding domain-containing protein [Ferruginibacter sp.]